ncbi:hypothetical protein Trydic_g5102 [Trypoxylus dichotomus]
MEIGNQLPLLDVLVIKKEYGTSGHTVYRKASHINTELQEVAKILVSRHQGLADAKHIRTETSEPTVSHTINRAFHAKTKPMDTITYVIKSNLPHMKAITDKIRRIGTIFFTDRKI